MEGKPLQEVETILNKASTPASFSASLDGKISNPFSTSLKTHVTTQAKARDRLAQIYEKIAREASSLGNTKRGNIYSDFAQRVKDGQFTEENIYSKLFDEIYNGLRKADYAPTSRFNPNIADLTGKETSLIQVKDEGGWHYRLPKNRTNIGWSTSDKCIDRISVNAETDEKLITSLDDLFTSGKIKGYYKTPDQSASWLDRHDPITIYLHEGATPSVLKEIERITAPHIRSRENVLVGKTFAPGLALEKSPQISEISSLLDEARLLNPQLEKVLKQNFTSNGELKASAGQMTSVQALLKYLEIRKINPTT